MYYLYVTADMPSIQRSSSPLPKGEPIQPVSPVIRSSPDHIRQTAFLSTQLCNFYPYQLDFVQIFPGMVIVLLSEVLWLCMQNILLTREQFCDLFKYIPDLVVFFIYICCIFHFYHYSNQTSFSLFLSLFYLSLLKKLIHYKINRKYIDLNIHRNVWVIHVRYF